jgi:hypothetical protein
MVAAGGWRGEVENVALSDTKVLEKLPCGVRKAGGNGAAEGGGEILDDFVKGSVCLAAVKEVY